ncbi:MAG: nucleotide pyrophosphohydrolase [Lachnospiraceae bacterium]|nr:nucleotide pyrophosphohydrolase [Lachnospiraceae bacterium]
MTETERLRSIVEKLRSEDGCAWDRAQTHESLKPECIEEAAEVICGINILEETGDATNLKEELGDLLLQVMFHSVIAQEEGLFTFDDVAKAISEKMIRRHPHVFVGVTYASD